MNKSLQRFGKFALTAMLILVIANLAYDKLKAPKDNPKSNPARQETPAVSPQPAKILNDSIVNFGMEFLGTPYVAAGCSKDGFDCSGFVYFVFRHFKIEVPRSSAAFEHFGTAIPIEHVRKGDLLLFLSPTRNAIGHIGIVSDAKGRQSSFIHASSGSEMKVIVTSLANEGYKRRFVKAVRVL